MARVSKKKIKIVDKSYSVALYARLSIENSGYKDINSIENQIEILRNFIKDKDDFILVDEYIDNGYTGTNFERPAFKRMIADIKDKKINTVIVKDLSRFGRKNIETEEFLTSIFPFLKVRFIAVTDMIDTFENGHGNKFLLSGFKNMINEIYAKDISRKVKATFDTKRKKGDYIGGIAPYGYKKDLKNKNKLVIDEEVADNVRLIFLLRQKGESYLSIARKLNELKIITPFMYREEKGTYTTRDNSRLVWRPEAVKFILSSEMYIGNIVQGKSFKDVDGKRKPVSKENWVIVENTHEAIIDKDEFYYIQQLNKNTKEEHISAYAEKVKSIENPFVGKLVCGICGERLMFLREKSKKGDKYYYFYYCRVRQQNLSNCNNSRISYNKILNIFSMAVEKEIVKLGSDIELLKIKEELAVNHTVSNKKNNILKITRDIEGLKEKSMNMIVEFSQGELPTEVFEKRFKVIQEQLEKLELEHKKLDKEVQLLEKSSIELDKEKDKFKIVQNLLKNENVTRELVGALIEKIVVNPEKDIAIFLKHKEVIQRLEGVYE